MKYDLIVIGGGVSGMTAAICAAERGKKVLILEKGDRVGRKLLATGNGKCNLANTASTVGRYNTRFVDEILAEYPLGAQSEFFLGLGLLTRENAGRIYPYSEQASTVLNVMRAALDRYGVEVLTSVGAERAEGHYTVNGKYHAENLLIATGSDASFGYESLSLVYPYGHSSTRRIPSLVPLITDKTNLKGLKGIRARVKAVLCEGEREISSVSDEIIFKDNGVSGTAIFGLSTFHAFDAPLGADRHIFQLHDKILLKFLNNVNFLSSLIIHPDAAVSDGEQQRRIARRLQHLDGGSAVKPELRQSSLLLSIQFQAHDRGFSHHFQLC